MARKRRRLYVKDDREELPELKLPPQIKRGIMIILFFLLAAVSFLSFFGEAGAMGAVIAKVMSLLFGWAAVVAPLIFLSVGIGLFLAGRPGREPAPSNTRVYIGAILLTFALTSVLHLVAMHRAGQTIAFTLVRRGEGGGYLGLLTAFPLYSLADFWVSILIMSSLLVASLLVLFNLNLAALLRRSREGAPNAVIKPQTPDIKINKMQAPGFNVSSVTDEEAGVHEPDEQKVAPAANLQFGKGGPDRQEKQISYGLATAAFRKNNWQLPPITLLEDSHTVVDSGNIEANVAIIQRTLADFGIEVEMGEVNVGPTVTQYTLRPATGIKLSQILTLHNDLALALAASAIRIEAPIPGRSLVGIEVPNKATAIVRLKDIVQTETFVTQKSKLGFALGRDVAGHPAIADLAAMPHLLIAGATGTGKSVAINSLLTSLLYRNSPEELRFIVIDPKRVELNLYNGIPHLLTPVVTDHDKAVNALKWAVREMDRRYRLLAESSKRNITEYNSNLPAGREALDPLPYIVIIVDELADLMAVAQADVEAAIVRLAQMARAVGVHLVVATQRPSVDIITGLIKANITSRIAFAVASQIDSRTILDMGGAEKLLGSGDMLYITSDLGKPRRIQGTYISEKEVRGVVDFIKNQAGHVEYAEGILEKPGSGVRASGFLEDGDDDSDELLPEAIALVRQAGKASASLLQRRLRLGYARAARLLDLMEEQGIIGPGDGAKPRDVYYQDRDDGSGDYGEE